MKTISIFGSTGSIGRQTIEVIKQLPEIFKIQILAGNKNLQILAAQAREFKPEILLASPEILEELKKLVGHSVKQILPLTDFSDLNFSLSQKLDVCVFAISGSAALKYLPNCIKSSHRLAMANKEAIICLGPLLFKLLKLHKTELIPVDSEHNTIWQLLKIGQPAQITITASGGPFLGWDQSALQNVTPEIASKHPKWQMGTKISIDSATTANKALEVIEAFYLFGQIPAVLIHPQALVHAILNFKSGFSILGLANPDMRHHIAQAITYPDSEIYRSSNADLTSQNLDFLPTTSAPFPFIELAQNIAKTAPHLGIALNCANEFYVEKFLASQIKFNQIYELVEKIVQISNYSPPKNLEEVVEIEQETQRLIQYNYQT